MSGTKKIIWPQNREKKKKKKKNTMDPYDGNDSISFDISKSQSQKSKIYSVSILNEESWLKTYMTNTNMQLSPQN